jgi:hypothetical protein
VVKKADRDEALRSLESRDWSNAVVDNTPASGAMVTLGGRFRPEQADRVMAEAQRRGVPVSEALRDLVDEAFAARAAAGEEPVTVRPADLLRALRDAAEPRRPAA